MANYALAIRFKSEPCRLLGFASVSSAYMGVGTAFDNPIRLLIVQNFTNQPLWFSLDGVTDAIPINAQGALTLDITSNKSVNGALLAAAAGDRVYVKQFDGTPLPSSGGVYVSAFYAADGY
jgi:hypothetical protein